jgi:hypothetical protein
MLSHVKVAEKMRGFTLATCTVTATPSAASAWFAEACTC